MLPNTLPGPANLFARIGLTIRHGFSLWWNPIDYVTKMGHTYGDLSMFRVFSRRIHVVNGPSLIRDILVTNQKSYRKMDRTRELFGGGFGNGLILSDGPFWLQQRRALQPIFQHQRIENYSEIVVAHTQRLIESWRGKPRVKLAEEMTKLTMTIIGQVLFQTDLVDRAAHYTRLAFEGTNIYAREEYSLVVPPDHFPLPIKRRKRAILQEFRALMEELVAARSKGGERQGKPLTTLQAACGKPVEEGGMSHEQVIDEAMTLFHAGYHSSSMALNWLLFTLAQQPDIYARLCAEVDEVLSGRTPTFADLPALTYTNQVVKEGLRLYPPAWGLFGRENIEDVELGGYHIPRGGIFLIYPLVTQRDPRFFPDPLRFDPERFSPERENEIPPFAYFPFGGGPHVCIGATFASMEIALILATLTQQMRVELAPGQRTKVGLIPRIAIRPEKEIYITPVTRKQSSTVLVS